MSGDERYFGMLEPPFTVLSRVLRHHLLVTSEFLVTPEPIAEPIGLIRGVYTHIFWHSSSTSATKTATTTPTGGTP
jgi:hypothetical protein